MPVSPSSPSPDIAVIGGGIAGLWCAHEAARRGARVALIEKRTIGAGASGGMLGALMPHQPTGWNAGKRFQRDGLVALPDRIAALEAETGLSCGYRRVGRLVPIANAEKRRQSAQWAKGANAHWPRGLRWTVEDANPAPGWLACPAMPHGVNHDTLSARLDPRALLAALRAALERTERVSIRQGVPVEALAEDGRMILPGGRTMTAGATIVAAGTGAFALIDPADPARIGRGVKGQGALLRPARPVDPERPLLYDKGVYAIAHESGLVAVGSTSEDVFQAPDATDERLDGPIARARALCPALLNAEIVERWAGARPRAAGREPLVGPLPGAPRTIVATGGFKITFAIAHLMADAAVRFALGETPADLPATFLPAHRIRAGLASQDRLCHRKGRERTRR